MATGHVSLDPQIQAVLDGVPPDAPSTRELGVEEARSDLERMAVAMCGNGEGVGWSEDRRVPGPGGEVPVRLYAPDVEGPLPVVVYLHGGGWAVGSLDSFDALCRRLANRTAALVVSVAYRLAPEHPFPAAVEDAEVAVRWTHAHAPELGADPERIAVAGDSAGANLATVVARHLRDTEGPELALQALIYPALDPALASESFRALGDDYMLSRSDMAWFWKLYLSGADPQHPDAAPARAAELSGLAPAYVLTAEYDPLRDEGEAYAAQLEAAGVPTTLRRWPGVAEADAFRRFTERSAAGQARDVQVLYGIGGERRLREQELKLDGYRGSRPVHVGNGAADQLQLDALGEIVNLSWRWHRRGHSPDDDLWRFIVSLVDAAAEQWREPDKGLWEWRGEPEHFVHSKVLCFSALDRGLRLADECLRQAPTRRWKKARDEVREAVEAQGYDAQRGVFVQAFGRANMDAALLLLPSVEFVAWDDERMVRTVDAIREDLDAGSGLLYRYRREDGLEGDEGAFLACSFWLVECLARQDRDDEARVAFDAALATANDLGLFSEEWDPQAGEMLGNFPQGLTHLAHIAACLALNEPRTGVGR